MNLKALELEMTRYLLFSAAASTVFFLVTMCVIYLVVKNAIRDGIKESGLLEMLKHRPRANSSHSVVPDMRAD